MRVIVMIMRVAPMTVGAATTVWIRARGIFLVRVRMKMGSTKVNMDVGVERKTSRHRQNIGGRRKNRD